MSYNGSGTFLINTAGQPVVSGTVISSTAFNALTADLATGLSTAITKDGQTTVTANIPMGTYKFTGLGAGTAATDSANLSQVQSTVTKLLASVSGADTITAVGSPTLGAYAAGQMFYFIAAGDNTGAVTLNIDSLGAKAVTRDGTTALAAGDIQSGEVCVVVYDGTRFQLVNGASQSASIVTENLTVNKATVLNESGGDNDTRIEGDTDANLFFADASTDRIGIGTSSPSQKLDASVASTTQGSGFGVTNSQAGGYGSGVTFYSFRSDGTTKLAAAQIYAEGAQSWADAGNTASNLVFKTVDNNTLATRMHISSGGNVGIGTTSPATRLHVSTAADEIARFQTSGTGGYISINEGSTRRGYIEMNNTIASIAVDANVPLRFLTNATERARITAAGEMLVGTTTAEGNGMTLTSGSGNYVFWTQVSTTNQKDHWRLGNPNGQVASIYTSGSSGGLYNLSDQRAKKNIVDAPPALQSILDTKIRSFDWIVDDVHQEYGGIAQEFQLTIPEAVITPSDEGAMLAIDWAKPIPRLIKAIQEQQAMIKSLEAKVAALEAK